MPGPREGGEEEEQGERRSTYRQVTLSQVLSALQSQAADASGSVETLSRVSMSSDTEPRAIEMMASRVSLE